MLIKKHLSILSLVISSVFSASVLASPQSSYGDNKYYDDEEIADVVLMTRGARSYADSVEHFVLWAYKNNWIDHRVTVVLSDPTEFVEGRPAESAAFSDLSSDGYCVVYLSGRLFHDDWSSPWSEEDEMVLAHELAHCKMYNVNAFAPRGLRAPTMRSTRVLNKTHFSSHVGHGLPMSALAEAFADFYSNSMLSAYNKSAMSKTVWLELLAARAPMKNIVGEPDPYEASYLVMPKLPPPYISSKTPEIAAQEASVLATKALKLWMKDKSKAYISKDEWGIDNFVEVDKAVIASRNAVSEDSSTVYGWDDKVKNIYDAELTNNEIIWYSAVKGFNAAYQEDLKVASAEFWFWIYSD